MFTRKIYDRLCNWKRDSDGRTALLIEGGPPGREIDNSGRVCAEGVSELYFD